MIQCDRLFIEAYSFERFSKAVNKLLDGRLFTVPGSRGLAAPDDARLPQGRSIFSSSRTAFSSVNFSESSNVGRDEGLPEDPTPGL